MIKLDHIKIEGFRGIAGRLDVDLSAPITLIYAPNGAGKTSICDAAEWLLTNSIRRLEESGAEASDFRCDFASRDLPTRVSGSMMVYGETIEVERLLGTCRWRRNNGAFKVVSQSDFLETLAPSAAERLMESSANLDEIAKLESELAPIEAERNRLTSYALAAEAAQKAYLDMRQQHVRRQMEEFVRVISALFTRMQSNEVYDRISEGDASSPLSWRAISEGFAMNPDLRFSQGQRQDFALSIFLARARGLGGTFFLDEPLVHLDDLNRVALLDVFRAICLEKNQNISIVLTTASKPILRHFVEKFSRVSRADQSEHAPLLRVIHLEGNPRAGVSLS